MRRATALRLKKVRDMASLGFASLRAAGPRPLLAGRIPRSPRRAEAKLRAVIRFDADARVVHCELGDLLEPPDPAPGQVRDVGFTARVEWNGLELHIAAFVDALHDTRGGTIPEVHRVVDPAEPEAGRAREIERSGLCALLLRRAGKTVRRARLIERAPSGEELGRIEVACAERTWTARLEACLARRLPDPHAASQRSRARAQLAESLPFPFAQIRPGQDALLRDVEGAARGGLVLMCAAPTGLGKTAAALYPLLRAAVREERQLYFATAKVSQQALALDTLRRMLPPGSPAWAVQISARHRVCPVERHGCTRDGPAGGRCALRRDLAARLARSGLEAELCALGVIDSEALVERALAERLCPFEVSLTLARSACAIVGDFNYVFDPHARLELLGEPERAPLLIVDEAHNLAERARGYFSPALAVDELERLSIALAPLRARVYRGARALFGAAAAHLRERAARLAEERSDPAPWVEAPDRSFWEEVGERAVALQAEYRVQIGGERTRPEPLRARPAGADPRPRDPALAALQALADFARCAALDPERSACIWRPGAARVVCLDPAAWLAPIWRRFHAVVCMSATLAPFEFHRRMLGLESPRTELLDLPSPFPAHNRLLVAVGSVDTTFRRRDDDAGRIAELIARCTALRPGNYLAFFPSFQYRDAVVAKLPAGGPRVLLQIPGLPVAPILKKLARSREGSMLVCGVHGGALAEGVDYPGELAIGVFVVGPGLPAVSLEQELIREYYERQLGQGFDYAYLFPGLGRAVQAAGRALRTPEDRAAILLLCRRFSEPMYRERLPAWWREELLDVSDPVPALRAFWEAGA
jgi:DNA excision repair protein ERCC-2